MMMMMMMMMMKRCLTSTGRDPEGPTEVCLNIMYSYWQCSTHSIYIEWNLEFDIYTEVMSIWRN